MVLHNGRLVLHGLGALIASARLAVFLAVCVLSHPRSRSLQFYDAFTTMSIGASVFMKMPIPIVLGLVRARTPGESSLQRRTPGRQLHVWNAVRAHYQQHQSHVASARCCPAKTKDGGRAFCTAVLGEAHMSLVEHAPFDECVF